MFFTASCFAGNVIYRVQEARKCRMLNCICFKKNLISIIYEVIQEFPYISISNYNNTKIKVLKLNFEANK